jgi:hypothetical protein
MDSAGRPSSVRLKISDATRYDEGRVATGATIKAGMLIKRDSSGTYIPHGTADGPCERLIATEDVNVLRGKGIDDDYVAGDLVGFLCCLPGDEVFMFTKDEQNFANGDYLVSGGDGSVQKYVAPAAATTHPTLVGTMMEALNNTGAPGNVRGKVRIM